MKGLPIFKHHRPFRESGLRSRLTFALVMTFAAISLSIFYLLSRLVSHTYHSVICVLHCWLNAYSQMPAFLLKARYRTSHAIQLTKGINVSRMSRISGASTRRIFRWNGSQLFPRIFLMDVMSRLRRCSRAMGLGIRLQRSRRFMASWLRLSKKMPLCSLGSMRF